MTSLFASDMVQSPWKQVLKSNSNVPNLAWVAPGVAVPRAAAPGTSRLQLQAARLGEAVEERRLGDLVDQLGDLVVGGVRAERGDVGVGDERRVDRQLAGQGQRRTLGRVER